LELWPPASNPVSARRDGVGRLCEAVGTGAVRHLSLGGAHPGGVFYLVVRAGVRSSGPYQLQFSKS
jgi:hypothetical protein